MRTWGSIIRVFTLSRLHCFPPEGPQNLPTPDHLHAQEHLSWHGPTHYKVPALCIGDHLLRTSEALFGKPGSLHLPSPASLDPAFLAREWEEGLSLQAANSFQSLLSLWLSLTPLRSGPQGGTKTNILPVTESLEVTRQSQQTLASQGMKVPAEVCWAASCCPHLPSRTAVCRVSPS